MCLVYIVPVFLICISRSTPVASGQSLTNAIHRTQAATERVNDLWCYECDTMDDGESCVEVVARNTSSHLKKCTGEEFICMVKRFSYTTSTENSTSSPKMWSLARRCAVNCEAGCIIIGERTKLYACTSCCEKSLCNIGRGGASSVSLNAASVILLMGLTFLEILRKFTTTTTYQFRQLGTL